MMKRKFFSIPLAILMVISLAAGCSNTEKAEKNIFAMDTVMDIKIYGKGAMDAADEAEEEIIHLDKILDRKEGEGEIYPLNETGGAQISGDTKNIIEKAIQMSNLTEGAFDITISPVMDLWGFYTKDFYVPSDDELNKALKKVDYKNIVLEKNTVTLNNEAQIDLGGIAKGYASGKIARELRRNGINSAIISLGGNVETVGERPDGRMWTVGIQHPDKDGLLGTLKVKDKAVITSGAYQRFFEKDGKTYHHIINPKTGKSAQSGIKSATVISADSAGADALSTALYVMGIDRARELLKSSKEYDAVIMTEDNSVYVTEGIKDLWQSEYGYDVI